MTEGVDSLNGEEGDGWRGAMVRRLAREEEAAAGTD